MPPSDSDARPEGRSPVVMFPFLWAASAAAAYAAWSEVDRGDGLPRVWLVTVVWCLSPVLLNWAPRAPRPAAYLLGLGNAVTYAVSGLLAGHDSWPVLWSTLCVLTMSGVVIYGYARVAAPYDWAPHTLRAVVGYLLVGATAGGLVALVGGFPGQAPMQPDPQHALAWWAWDGVWAMGVLTPVIVVLMWRSARREPAWHWLLVPILAVATALALSTAYYGMVVPRSWVGLVPLVAAGSLLQPRLLAVYLLATGPAIAVALRLGDTDGPHLESLGALTMLYALLVFGAFVGLALSVGNEERQRLIDALQGEKRVADRRAQTLETLFEAMIDGFIAGDPDGEVWLHNSAAVRLLGRDFVNPEGLPWADYFALVDLEGRSAGYLLATLNDVRNGRLVRFTLRTLQTVETPSRVLDLIAVPVELDRGAGAGIFLHDVTSETAQMQEMSRFAGTVAHDLRNPLSVVTTMQQLAADLLTHDTERAAVALRRAGEGALAMTRVIDGWLAHTVVQSGALTLAPTSVEVVVENMLSGGLVLPPDATVVVDAPHLVRADQLLLRQTLANIVGNAIKYARPGEPAYVVVTTTRNSRGMIEVAVADRGVGVPEGDASWLLDEGRRETKHADLAFGSGLGLALCRRIAERHGGSLTISRNEHGGTTVRFTLPSGG